MPQVQTDGSLFDRSEYRKADRQFKLAEQRLPPTAIEALAREVVDRIAFRLPGDTQHVNLPSSSEIEDLCTALVSADEKAADRLILAARRGGASIETIYLGYVAGAARKLGDKWNDDEVTFVEVTLGTGRLYRIVRGLRRIIAATLSADRDVRPALFALVPGEDHTLGIELATDLFRREGWDVDMLVGQSHDDLLDTSETRSYRAVVLVANSDRMIEPLARLVPALRITQPLAHVAIAGNILAQFPDIAQLVGADDVVDDIETAVATLHAVLDGDT